MEDFLQFIRAYKWRIIGIVGGIVFTILIFTINFWRTLLLALIVAVCYLIGYLLDQGGREAVAQFFQAFSARRADCC